MNTVPLEQETVYRKSAFARRGLLETGDPCACEVHSGAWDVCIVPTSSARFSNQKDYFVTPNITVYRDYYTNSAQITGALEPGVIALILPLQYGGESRYFGLEARPGYTPITDSSCVTGSFFAGEAHIICLMSLPFLE